MHQATVSGAVNAQNVVVVSTNSGVGVLDVNSNFFYSILSFFYYF